MGEEDGSPVAASDDLDEEKEREREEQRIQDEPELAEDRVEVPALHVGPRELDDELPPSPDLAHVRPERRQPDSVRLVDVPLGSVVVVALPFLFGDRAHVLSAFRRDTDLLPG